MAYGKRFQKHRKLFHSVFSRIESHKFEDALTEEAQFLVKSLIEKPESYNWLVRRSTGCRAQRPPLLINIFALRYATALVMAVAYGHRIRSDDDEYLKMGGTLSAALDAGASAGTAPPDLLPFCER
jgi:hypothetical protein